MSSFMRNLFNFDEHFHTRISDRRKAHRESLSAEYQLGYFVGEVIFLKYLPTLSIDYLQTINVVKVSPEDEEKYVKNDDEWYNEDDSSLKEMRWKIRNDISKELAKKYLPNPLICHLPPLNITDMDEFKSGLIVNLFNSDVCYYSLDKNDIKIYHHPTNYFTIIELKLDD